MLLRFRNQAARFVKDYATNTVKAPRSAFVDAKGRIVAMFDQHKVSDDEMWVIIEGRFRDRLMDHLYKYLYITDTKAEPDPKMNIYWDLDGDGEPPEDAVVIPQWAGKMWLTAAKLPADVSKADMTLFRVVNGIPWQGEDYDQEMLLTVADEEVVSYLKGCYLGQETVARVHYRGRPPKKLVVKMLRDCTPEQRPLMTSRVTHPATGEITGFVFDKTGDGV
jgi:tRNA-modifying protein YgfZ